MSLMGSNWEELSLTQMSSEIPLKGGVPHGFQRGRDGRRSAGMPMRDPGLADGGKAGSDRQFAGDEVGATRRAARLGVVVGEAHAFRGELVEVRRAPGHDFLVVGADVEPADIIAHDKDDVRPLIRRCRCRPGCLLLRLRRAFQSKGRKRRGRNKRTAAQQQTRRFSSALAGLMLVSGLFGILLLLMTQSSLPLRGRRMNRFG